MIRDGGSDWAGREPYKSFVRAAEEQEAHGISTADIADALVSMGVTWAAEMHGPRRIAQQLYWLAMTFAAQADRADAATNGGAGAVH